MMDDIWDMKTLILIHFTPKGETVNNEICQLPTANCKLLPSPKSKIKINFQKI